MPAAALTPRQEAFARRLSEGRSQRDAYISAGYSARGVTADEAASRLARNVKVQHRLAELKAKHARRNEVTVDTIVQRLEECRRAALQVGQVGAAVAAVLGTAKVLGLIIDRGELNVVRSKPSLFPTKALELSEEEWLASFGPKGSTTEH